MSNEYKDWIWDRVQDVLLDNCQIDKVEEVIPSPITDIYYVHGWKNGEKVAFAVWFDDDLCDWQFEHRELNN